MSPLRRQRSPEDAPRLRQLGPRVATAWRRARRATDRYRLLTDVVGAILIVAVVVGSLAAATGGIWPPVLTVESGSMMHAIPDTPYGRMGTIDVGDLVFVRAVKDPLAIETWAQGGEHRYGRPGTVIAFAQDGNHANTTILHRAIAFVEVAQDAQGRPLYRLHWTEGQVLEFDQRGIYFPPLGFNEAHGFTRANGYKPSYTGYLTKGDNALTNPTVDQAIGISLIVEPAWIVGEIYGEIPWLGLGKLALQSGKTNPMVPGWERVGNGFAPLELWSCFFVVVALVILVPFSIDTWRAYQQHREREELLAQARREQEAHEREARARRQFQQATRGPSRAPVTFVAVGPPRRRE